MVDSPKPADAVDHGIAIRRAAAAAHVAARAAANGVSMVEVTGDGAKYWPRWRGPTGQGLAAFGTYTDAWSATEGVKWKTKVPGSGNSSPIVWKDRIFLTTSENDGAALSLLSFDRANGKLLMDGQGQHFRSDPDAGGGARPCVCLVGACRPDLRDPSRRQG